MRPMRPDQLRCPLCGTPVPDTGMRSAGGIGPGPDELPDVPSAAWKQHGKCPSCHRLLVRNVVTPEAPQLEQWRLPPGLLKMGGTATVRATPTPMASGGVVREPSSHLRWDTVLSASVSAVAKVHGEVGVNRVTWDASVTGFGAMLGQSALGQKGMVVGGAAAYFWARRRWPDGTDE
jgi:hypothetical protein